MLPAVGVAALAAFAVQSLAWPLYHGRDAETYLYYWFDMWSGQPVYPLIMLYRTPLAPLFFGPLLDFFGGGVTEAACAVLYAVAIVLVVAAARRFGARVAVATAIALLLYPAYGAIFHGVATEPVYAVGIALWTLLIVSTPDRPSVPVFVLHGLVVFLLVLVRPPSQIFLVFALYPLLLRTFPLRRRLAWSGAFAATVVTLVLGWASYNELRYDDFTVARTSLGANFPLVRLFTLDHIVRPENGPASRELGIAVDRDLLNREPYRTYHVTVDEFFARGNSLAWSDLVTLADRTWGWDSDYAKLRAVSLEAIEAHPATYVHHVAGTLRYELWSHFTLPAQLRRDAQVHPKPRQAMLVDGRRVPRPPAGQLTPESHLPWVASTPDGRITMDWSDMWHPRYRYADPRDALRARELESDLRRVEAQLPSRDGSSTVASVLNGVSRLYPRALLLLVLAAVGIVVRRPRLALETVTLCGLALVMLVSTALGQPTAVAFRVPFDPIFVLAALAAWLAPRADRVSAGGRGTSAPRAPG